MNALIFFFLASLSSSLLLLGAGLVISQSHFDDCWWRYSVNSISVPKSFIFVVEVASKEARVGLDFVYYELAYETER